MARPRKQPVEIVEEVLDSQSEETTEQEKPPAQVIDVPYLDVQSQIMGQSLNALRAAQEAAKKAAEEAKSTEEESGQVEEPVSPPLVVWDMNKEPEKPKVYYGVYDRGDLIFVTDSESEKIDAFLADNKSELEAWIVDLSTEVTNEQDIIFMNCPPNTQNYSSYSQYLAQHGLAPAPPKYKSWLDYYRNAYNGMSDEEIAIKVFGNLRYSFSPVKLI